jgi:hypothetical protein
MSTYRWAARSTTPGQYRWTNAAVALLFAEQLATDKSAVTAAAASIKDDATILTIDGTYDFTQAIADGFSAGQADQLSTDQAAVGAVAEYITTAVTDLLGTVDGTLNMSLYTLISGVASQYNVRSGQACYSGGPTGLIIVPAVGDVRKGVLVNVEDAVGTLVGCVDADGVNQGATGVLEAGSVYSALALWELISTGDSRVAAQLQDDKDAVTVGKADILTTRTILTIQGTYTPDFPDVGNVTTTDTVDGEAGTLNMSLYELVTTGDSRVAAQLDTDEAAVDAKKAYLDDTQTILGIAGTLDMDLYELVTTGDTRVASQLQDDKDAVTVGKADILNSRTILTITGTFDLAANDAAVAAEQHATDAAFLETNKDEIIAADTDILGEFGVTGTAEVGGTVIVIED